VIVELNKRVHSAFTLVELLIGLVITTILLGLLLPAIHGAREASRRLACVNNLRQLGLALHMHSDQYRRIPNNGGFTPESTIMSPSGSFEIILTEDFEAHETYRWGIGNPLPKSAGQAGSWAYSILPFLDQMNAYQEIAVGKRQPLFLCPSRARYEPTIPKRDRHGRYEAAQQAWAKTDYAGNARVTPSLPFYLTFSSIQDGLTQTLAIGEKAFDPSVQTASSWYWDEPIFSGGSKGTSRAGLRISNDRIGIDFKNNWGSSHRGGVQFTLADGSVRFITQEVDWEAFRAMLTPDGGEIEANELLLE
jgi:type II secretory pathway pseudopilin PulG